MNMPDWWEGLLLGLAAWRTWQLLADDTILERPRRYITRRWKPLEDFIDCPYCLGFWVALGWVVGFAVFPSETPWVALPFAVNTVVVVVNHWLSDR